MFGDHLKQQKLFLRWMDFSKVPSKVLSCPMCLVSYDKLTMFFPAVPVTCHLNLSSVTYNILPVTFYLYCFTF